MGKRQEAALETRQKLVDAMRSLLQEKKADTINIEEITTRAGVAKGSFYSHFKRKEDVISVIAMEQYQMMMEKVLALTGNVYERICEYLTCSARIIDEETLQVAQNWMKSVTAPIAGEHSGAEKYQYDHDNIRKLLNDGAARGELAETTPVETLTRIIMDAYYGAVVNWCITSGEADLISGIRNFCQYGLKSLLKPYQSEGGTNV